MLTAFILDDEPLAVARLQRMVASLVQVAGTSNDPVEAIELIDQLQPDLLFLDVQMPELDGFAVLRRLAHQPLVIFTTAYDQYALAAFDTNSVAYLLKPVEDAKLRLAISKVDRLRGTSNVQQLLAQVTPRPSTYPERVSSKTGDRIEFIDLSRISHFYAEDKLTFASTEGKDYIVDQTISELEERLDPSRFFRIHRSSLVQLEFVAEMYNYLGGKLLIRLKNTRKTELTVSKERARELRDRLGL